MKLMKWLMRKMVRHQSFKCSQVKPGNSSVVLASIFMTSLCIYGLCISTEHKIVEGLWSAAQGNDCFRSCLIMGEIYISIHQYLLGVNQFYHHDFYGFLYCGWSVYTTCLLDGVKMHSILQWNGELGLEDVRWAARLIAEITSPVICYYHLMNKIPVSCQ